MRRLNQQLEANEEITVALQHTIAQRERELSELRRVLSNKDDLIQGISRQLEQQRAAVPKTPACEKQINLVWESLLSPPIDMVPRSSTVHSNQVYVKDDRNVFRFNYETREWCKMPLHPIHNFTLVCVEDMLTTVGGWEDGFSEGPTNKVYTLIDNKWLKHFPAMRVKRQKPAAVYANNTLVVTGGYTCTTKVELHVSNDVEVLNTRTKQWFTSPALVSMSRLAAVVCRDHFYTTPVLSYYIFKCSRLALIGSTQLREKYGKRLLICL